jgi:hypothetical protein
MYEDHDYVLCPRCLNLTVLPCYQCTQYMSENALRQYLIAFDTMRRIIEVPKSAVREIETVDTSQDVAGAAREVRGAEPDDDLSMYERTMPEGLLQAVYVYDDHWPDAHSPPHELLIRSMFGVAMSSAP